MATSPFANVGMSQLGSEQSYMHGSSPLNEAFKAVQDFAMLAAIDKSGLAGYLNSIGQKTEDLKNKAKTPPDGSAAPNVAPAPVNPQAMAPAPSAQPPVPGSSNQPFGGSFFNNAIQQPEKSIEDLADEAMGIKKSSVTPDLLKPRDPMQDQMQTQMASMPNPILQPPKYSGGGEDFLKLFLG
jgi:hypothetical protein